MEKKQEMVKRIYETPKVEVLNCEPAALLQNSIVEVGPDITQPLPDIEGHDDL